MPFRNQEGAAVVEFAIVLPLLMLLIFGTIEFGLLYYNKQVLTNASRVGARAGITMEEIADADNPNHSLWVRKYAPIHVEAIVFRYFRDHQIFSLDGDINLRPNLGDDDILVSEKENGEGVENDLTVSIQYDYPLIFGGIIGFDSVLLTAETTMRVEYIPDDKKG